jgi:hypothetical protein
MRIKGRSSEVEGLRFKGGTLKPFKAHLIPFSLVVGLRIDRSFL